MGLRNAQVSERGNYFSPGGLFDLEITRVHVMQTQKSGIAFIVETEVLTSSMAAHPVGSSGTWFQKMASPAIAFSAIKGFYYAALGLDLRQDALAIAQEVDPVIEAFSDYAVSEANPLRGHYIHLETQATKTREKGMDFTVHKWSPMNFAALGGVAPDWRQLLRDAQAPRSPTYGGARPAAPGGYGAPPPPSGGPAPQLSPDGKFQLVGNQWIPYTPPAPAAPPPPPPAAGPQLSPDGRFQLVNGTWQPVPPPAPRGPLSPDGRFHLVNGAWLPV
jgi:hypothetical protein